MKRIFSTLLTISALLVPLLVTAQSNFERLKTNDMEETPRIIPNPMPIPIPRPPQIIVRGNFKAMVPQKLDIDVEVIGNIATTTYDIVYYNPNQAQLEGEFVLPLSENQNVSALALDINGKMRDGVVVEKEKGRQTFEAVVNRNVDPALAEKTSGNQFKLRIFPFPPNGTRHVRVTLEENLATKDGKYYYNLPLNYAQKLDEFSIKISIPSDKVESPKITTDLKDFSFNKQGTVYQAEFSAKDYELNNKLSFSIPKAKATQTFYHTENNTTYFYSDINVAKAEKAKALPNNIAIYWDASLSGTKRNIAAEKALLKAYLQKISDVEVSFTTFNLDKVLTKTFQIKNGDTTELEKEIDAIIYDGATRFDKLSKPENAKEVLIFSDGISTFGDTQIAEFGLPTYTINSSSEYERGLLTDVAQKSSASFINLTTLTQEAALNKLIMQPLRVIAYEHGDKISEVYPPLGTEVDENLSLAGILRADDGELKIKLGYAASDITSEETIKLTKGSKNSAVERLWAKEKIKSLELNAKENKAEILKLGQQYSIVTEGTSLIVLENVADYVQYEITPPEELLEEYNRIMDNKNKIKREEENSAIQDAISQAKIVKEWWEKKFDKDKPKPQKFEKLHQDQLAAGTTRFERRRLSASAARADMMVEDMMMAEEASADGEADNKSNSSPAKNTSGTLTAKVSIQAWNPDTPYMRILKKSNDAEIYRDYLKLKDGYDDQPSFYFDVCDEFNRRGLKQESLVILSNIAEMKLDSVELLRIAAQKLLEMKQSQYALELFKRIVELRGEDPQSYRDLALTYQEAGEAQQALDLFYSILNKKWPRFNTIKQVVFVEMNELIATNPKLDLSNIDKELIFKMPVDIRITLSWSTDNTDIDLHVKDPYDENCFYGHRLTHIGGRYTHDFTDGFGPEEFMLKEAIKGTYKIKTNNFGDRRQSISGPTTLYLDIFTHYATPEETHQRILVRTENVKEDNVIGEITFE